MEALKCLRSGARPLAQLLARPNNAPMHTTRHPLAFQLQARRLLSSKHPKGFTPPQSEDLIELRERVQEFAKHEIPEEVARKTDQDNEFPYDMWEKMGSAGLLGPTADEDVGGLAMGYQAHCIIMEELSRASASIGLSYAAHSQLCVNQLHLNGNNEQKQKYLPDLISGKKVGALAMSEHSAGSDVVSMRMTAKEVDGGYVLNGTKMWITNGPEADVVVVYAKTNPSAKSKGITAFILDTPRSNPASGFSVARKLDKLGMRGSNTGELIFEDVLIPSSQVLGKVDGGVRVLMEGLDLERLVLSSGPLGIMQRVLDEVLPYVHTREQFGKAIIDKQLVQGKVADIYTAFRSAQAFTHSIASHIDSSHDLPDTNFGIISRDCTATILFAAEAATRCALDGVQLMGGMGYMTETPVSRLFRDAKLYEIGAGTSEVRRMVVGKSFSKDYQSGIVPGVS